MEYRRLSAPRLDQTQDVHLQIHQLQMEQEVVLQTDLLALAQHL
jgi:hypothetical protein